jgi:ABC-2 type transport system permease protein
MFASNAVVPLATLPGWLKPFARDQPLSIAIAAVRALCESGSAAHFVWLTVSWSVGMFAVFFALSLRLYHRAGS